VCYRHWNYSAVRTYQLTLEVPGEMTGDKVLTLLDAFQAVAAVVGGFLRYNPLPESSQPLEIEHLLLKTVNHILIASWQIPLVRDEYHRHVIRDAQAMLRHDRSLAEAELFAVHLDRTQWSHAGAVWEVQDEEVRKVEL
jgi:hypothetical protein